MPALQAEYQFWMQNRSVALEVDGTRHVLNRYFVQVGLPRYVRVKVVHLIPHFLFLHLLFFLLINVLLFRPESYTDDLELAEGLSDGELSPVATEDFLNMCQKRPYFGKITSL